MNPTDLISLYSSHKHTKVIIESLKQTRSIIHLKGLTGSSSSLVCVSSFSKYNNTTLCILTDKEEAAYFFNDLTNLLGSPTPTLPKGKGVIKNVLFFPSSYKHSVPGNNDLDNTNIVLRTEVLNKLSSNNNNIIIISYPEALIEKVLTKNSLQANTIKLKVGEKISIDFITEALYEYEFERNDFVYEPGQFSVRGSIVDVFSFSNDFPYRIDFFGDEVDSIRTFNIEDQLSIEQFKEILIFPNIQKILLKDVKESFFSFIPSNTAIWVKDAKFIIDRINKLYETPMLNSGLTNNIVSGNEIADKLSSFSVIEFGHQFFYKPNITLKYNISPQPSFNKNFELLSKNLYDNYIKGYKNIILSENNEQIERLKAIFNSTCPDLVGNETNINSTSTSVTADKPAFAKASADRQEIKFSPLLTTLNEGFIDNDLKICCYTDHQIFERYHKFHLKNSHISSAKGSVTIKEINQLHPGDYVVHVDHGIGIFGGLEKIKINHREQETVRLIYKDNDILYVNIHSLHRISKYKGGDGTPPKIYKLGSGAWLKLKQNTKNKVKDIAKELIALYAERKKQKGYEFSQDSYLNQELEASFFYEDTPDQLKATQDVKKNMESSYPMDRLICGDVGFGKTEIALRAAFKAVADSKQVAVLVPTTILALQHYKTFTDRLKNFPCTIDYISRLKSTKKQKETINRLAQGKIDILIGTHRIVSKDITFKDLGLLIIDEEQKFGVATKEKLRKLKLNVDTLTLTATPIPRTLQFSLMGARELSIINTPPPNRIPITTELHTFNEDLIREAINYEIERNGQVYFVHNRIQDIHKIAELVQRLCPDVRIAVVHGQMESSKLENKMIDFIEQRYDVLITTTIIEAGLDIPNVNTMIINNAHNFGLSDLHQLRGRVGRSNKKAFCYLFAPPLSFLTPEARRRLNAIEDFSELGSGFNIALQDLDIRGAGNLLGAEQSGFISDIGFETYHRILNEAIQELKEDEFSDQSGFAFPTSSVSPKVSGQAGEKEEIKKLSESSKLSESLCNKFVNDCHIDTDYELLFPDDYIYNVSERIKLYRELDNIENEEELQKFETHLIDRFGKLPEQSKGLLDIVRLRWIAITLGFEKIILKNNRMLAYFISNKESLYYQSSVFSSILEFLQKQPDICTMKEKNNKLSLNFENIKCLKEAINILRLISVCP